MGDGNVMTDEPRETKDEGIAKKPVSRREFLKYAGVAGGAIAVSGGLGGLIAACGGETTTTTAGGATTTAGGATTTAGGATTTTAAAATTTTWPQGRSSAALSSMIVPAGPQNVGYWPKMGPTDEGPIFPSVERINEYTADRTIVPHLAKTFTEEPDELTMTCELNRASCSMTAPS